jgi:hypothetical protein
MAHLKFIVTIYIRRASFSLALLFYMVGFRYPPHSVRHFYPSVDVQAELLSRKSHLKALTYTGTIIVLHSDDFL